MARIIGYKGILFSGGHPEDIEIQSLNDIFEDVGKSDMDDYLIEKAEVVYKGNGGLVIKFINEKEEVSSEYYLRTLYRHDNV